LKDSYGVGSVSFVCISDVFEKQLNKLKKMI